MAVGRILKTMAELLVILAIAVAALVVILPAARVLGRLGFSPLLGILAVIPVFNVILLWFVAYSSWSIPPAPGRR
jgi:hypothetical protein